MADLATLGLAVDSSQVRAAADDLRNFEAVARRTGETAEQVRDRFRRLNDEAGRGSKPLDDATRNQTKYSDATNKVIQSLALQEQRLNMTGKQWAVFQNLNKAGVSASSEAGQKIVQATEALYDLEQAQKKASAANDNANNSLNRFAQTMSRAIISGAVTLGVRELTKYLIDLNAQLASVGDTSKRVGISTGVFQQLEAVTGGKGISGGDLAGAAQDLSANLNQSLKYSTGLSQMFALNGKSLKDSAGNAKDLVSVLSDVADMVKNARTEQDKFLVLQEAGIPATSQWLKLLENGGVAFRLALRDAQEAGVETSAELIKKAQAFDDAWNKSWTNLKLNARAAFASALDYATTFYDKVEQRARDIGNSDFWKKFYSPESAKAAGVVLRDDPNFLASTGAPSKGAPQQRLQDSFSLVQAENDRVASAAKTKLLQDKIKENQVDQQRISILGPLASVEDQVRAKQLELDAVYLQTGVSAGKYRDAILNVVRAQAEQSRVQEQAQVGIFSFSAAQKAANDNLQVLVDKKLLDPSNAQQWAAAMNNSAKAVENLANQAKVAGAPLEGLQRLANEAGSVRTQVDQFATTSLNSLSDGLVSVRNGSASAGDAFRNFGLSVVSALQKMIIQLTIIKPLADALQGSLGAGGFLGFLGLGFSGGGYVDGVSGGSSSNPLPGLTASDYGPGFAGGGYTGGGGKYQPAGIVHAGEFVFDSVATSRAGVPYLNALHNTLRGYDVGGFVTAPSTPSFAGNVAQGPWGKQDNRPLNISIINQSSQPVSATAGKTPNGDPAIFLRDAVRGIMAEDAANNGPISEAFAARAQGFGAR